MQEEIVGFLIFCIVIATVVAGIALLLHSAQRCSRAALVKLGFRQLPASSAKTMDFSVILHWAQQIQLQYVRFFTRTDPGGVTFYLATMRAIAPKGLASGGCLESVLGIKIDRGDLPGVAVYQSDLAKFFNTGYRGGTIIKTGSVHFDDAFFIASMSDADTSFLHDPKILEALLALRDSALCIGGKWIMAMRPGKQMEPADVEQHMRLLLFIRDSLAKRS